MTGVDACAVDTSALARLLVQDTGSEQVLALVRSGAGLFGSSLLIAELLRVATRHELGYAGAERALRRVRMLTVDDAVLRDAGRLSMPGARVRTADAVHLVTAVRLQQSTFLTFDRTQARAAHVMGLLVCSPGLDDGWWR